MIPADDPRAPLYWMNETSGVLKPVIEKLLMATELTPMEVSVIRAYFRQWIDSPAWDVNPHENERSRAALADLRAQVRQIESMKDIEHSLAAMIAEGMDPL